VVEQTAKTNIKKNSMKKYAFLPLLLLLSAFLVTDSTQRFRYSEYNWIYQAGWILCYILHLLAFITSVINSLQIIMEMKTGIKDKLLWLFLCLMPIAFWVVIFIFIMLEISL